MTADNPDAPDTAIEVEVALAYAVEAMRREVERQRAAGMADGADLWAAQLDVIERHRRTA